MPGCKNKVSIATATQRSIRLLFIHCCQCTPYPPKSFSCNKVAMRCPDSHQYTSALKLQPTLHCMFHLSICRESVAQQEEIFPMVHHSLVTRWIWNGVWQLNAGHWPKSIHHAPVHVYSMLEMARTTLWCIATTLFLPLQSCISYFSGNSSLITNCCCDQMGRAITAVIPMTRSSWGSWKLAWSSRLM